MTPEPCAPPGTSLPLVIYKRDSVSDQTDLIQGTLDLLILRTIALEPMHGWAIAQRIQQISDDLLRVQQGSLYPALHRLEHQGWITAEWGASENNRRARFYSLTRAGRKQLDDRAVEVGAAVGRRQPRAGRGRSAMRLWHILRSRLRSLFFREPARGGAAAKSCSSTSTARPSGCVAARHVAPTAARQQALRAFGGVEPIKEVCRDARGTAPVDTLLRDTRYAVAAPASATGASPPPPS